MSPEEKPPEDPDSVSLSGASKAIDDSSSPSEPVIAEIADAPGNQRSLDKEIEIVPALLALPPAIPVAGNLENMSAKGGAIGSLALGILCVIGSFITSWSIINGMIGLLMGCWGLTSRNKTMAWIGIALCGLGIFLSLVQVNELVNTYFNARDEPG